jgi:hypothetical protein
MSQINTVTNSANVWFDVNYLKINVSKTEKIIFTLRLIEHENMAKSVSSVTLDQKLV